LHPAGTHALQLSTLLGNVAASSCIQYPTDSMVLQQQQQQSANK
jgi:hypothetical protein